MTEALWSLVDQYVNILRKENEPRESQFDYQERANDRFRERCRTTRISLIGQIVEMANVEGLEIQQSDLDLLPNGADDNLYARIIATLEKKLPSRERVFNEKVVNPFQDSGSR